MLIFLIMLLKVLLGTSIFCISAYTIAITVREITKMFIE